MNKEPTLNLTDSVRYIKGVGQKTELTLMKLGIGTIQDLLRYYPRRYEIYNEPKLIKSIEPSELESQKLAIKGKIVQIYPIKQVRNLKILNCRVEDESASINITWFNMPYLRYKLKKNSWHIFYGKVEIKNNSYVMEQADLFTEQAYKSLMNTMQPIYSLTTGITSKTLSKIIQEGINKVDLLKDPLPESIREKYELINYERAIKHLHFPKDKNQFLIARKRLVFDEFFFFTFSLQGIKSKKVLWYNHFKIDEKEECNKLIDILPYKLTGAQLNAWTDIKEDLTGLGTMNRLIQGDVGSGKTIVAALALLLCALNGYQGSIMVPTEVLAKQHFQSLNELLAQFRIKTELLVGSMTAKMKKEAYDRIQKKESQIIVGTHALIQDKVEFSNLALVVTDEQHRFGVRQRESLAGKGIHPHVLVMSATPIPRTLAIILYSDMEVSIIDELPSNRLPIKNCLVNTNYRKTAYKFIEEEVKEGRQAYIICPMVEESEIMEGENVIDYAKKVKNAISSKIKVSYLHGKMKAAEKNGIMEDFSKGNIQVLVSTTVIEVGINVPNATVMMIENAERFGLAQLHQLRGRVGRGNYQSYCILVSSSKSKETKKRLEILLHSNDGFEIANEDLKLRGPGDMLGVRQSGELEFKLADIYQDSKVLINANEAVNSLTDDEKEYIEKVSIPLLCLDKYFYNNTL